MHRSPDGTVAPIKVANKYTGLALDERPVIMKLHGAVDRGDKKRDSYVLTENSYIDYLAGPPVSKQIPAALMAKMEESHFLFLGYSMRDWNLRVILHRIWGGQKLSYKSWSVQLAPDVVEVESWEQRGVDIIDMALDAYIAALDPCLRAPEDEAPAPA
jgi:hypothetical protein